VLQGRWKCTSLGLEIILSTSCRLKHIDLFNNLVSYLKPILKKEMSNKLAMVIFPLLLSCQVVVAQNLPPDASDCLKDQYACSMNNMMGTRGCGMIIDPLNRTPEAEIKSKQCFCELEQKFNSW
jgi:hypothetical protein